MISSPSSLRFIHLTFTVILISLLQCTQTQAQDSTLGTRFSPCSEDRDCGENLECAELENDGWVSSSCDSYAGQDTCFCFDSDSTSCSSSDGCAVGYACASLVPDLSLAGWSYCIPCSSLSSRYPPPLLIGSSHSCDANFERATPTAMPSSQELLPCRSDSECAGSYECSEPDNDGYLSSSCDSAAAPCICSLRNSCSSSSGCQFGTVCVSLTSSAEWSYCVPCSAVGRWSPAPSAIDDEHFCTGGSGDWDDSSNGGDDDDDDGSTDDDDDGNSDEEDDDIDDGASNTDTGGNKDNGNVTRPSVSPAGGTPPCIAVHHLRHLSPKSLVFPSHRRAPVLCDGGMNCATAGHIVTVGGVGMMMSTYCGRFAVGGCVRRVMEVNSPKMRLAVRVKGNVGDGSDEDVMEFTAFSAKYESRVEEGVMAALVRMGL